MSCQRLIAVICRDLCYYVIRKPCYRSETTRCRCKIRYISKFTAASRGSPCDNTASCSVYLSSCALDLVTFLSSFCLTPTLHIAIATLVSESSASIFLLPSTFSVVSHIHFTLCLKKGTPTLSTVTLERINVF